MGRTINTNQPDRPMSGASLQRESVAGRKNQFVTDTGVGSGTTTIAAGGFATFLFIMFHWYPELAFVNQSVANAIPQSQLVLIPVLDSYVDTDNNSDFYMNTGSSLSGDQQKVHLEVVTQMGQGDYGSADYSGLIQVRVKNEGTSSHAVYIHMGCKAIAYGEQAL